MTAAKSVATLVAPQSAILSEAQIADIAARIKKSGGAVEKTLWLEPGRAADISFTGGQAATTGLPFDILIQPAAARRKKILIADMESTVIEQEMLDELAAEIGIGGKVAAITRRAMNGELDFGQSLIERARLLKGQPESLLYKVAARMTLTPGAQQLVTAMKQAGSACWLVSGGFDFFVRIIADRIGFNEYFANHLVIENGFITGEVAAPIRGKDFKKQMLEKACAACGCSLAETVTVGDGANDVPMLRACEEGGGLGVAYRAKPSVREIIHNQINHGDLSALIYAQGLMPG